MTQKFDPFRPQKPDKELDYGRLYSDTEVPSNAEENNEISNIEAAISGVASGILKIPEGFVSVGAELLDYSGITQRAAARVEQAFDKLNPFEEIAEQKAIGKITEALISVGFPAGAGAKIGYKLATKALQAKKLEHTLI
jgi:hypothetical protein